MTEMKIYQRGANNQKNKSMNHFKWTPNLVSDKQFPSDKLLLPPVPNKRLGRFAHSPRLQASAASVDQDRLLK